MKIYDAVTNIESSEFSFLYISPVHIHNSIYIKFSHTFSIVDGHSALASHQKLDLLSTDRNPGDFNPEKGRKVHSHASYPE